MFYPFDLTFETNKLVSRFDANGYKIVAEIMNNFESPEAKVFFAKILFDFNIKIKAIDNLFSEMFKDEMVKKEINIFLEEKVLDQLYSMMNINLFKMGYDFPKWYGHLYWENMRNFVKELWHAMPINKPVVGAIKGFKNLFDDFHDNVVEKYPNLFVKHLKDIGDMYRCRSWCVNDGYELMIPSELYVKDNRWNPDGVAYLYLACGDKNECYDGIINMVQKTCFEEIRLSEENEVAVCQFRPLKKDAKIIDLCYEGVDYSKISGELKTPPNEYAQTIIDKILESPKLSEKMMNEIKRNSKDEFLKKPGPELKRLMKQTGLEREIEELVYNSTSKILLGLIDESIFEVVDKSDDPTLKAYLPFRDFSQYLIDKGYDGVIYRSTRMNKIGMKGKNLVLFDKSHATYKDNTMEKYKYSSGKYIELN